MGLFDVFFKGALDKLNSNKLKKDNKNAPKIAYKQTGEEIKKAKAQGKTINGKQRFKVNLNNQKRKNQENHDARAKAIERL